MEDYLKIAVLENEIEAGLLESILEERGIPYLMRSYHDTAYDGLYQAQKGWGFIGVPESYKDVVLGILADIRQEGSHLVD